MEHNVVIAGFGGQGIMLIGELLARAGMEQGKEVTWLPSYGPEQRGGTANCAVVIADEPIASPLLPEPQAAIVFNRQSFDKFEPAVEKGGLLVVDATLIDRKSERSDITCVYIPATDIALELGELQVHQHGPAGSLSREGKSYPGRECPRTHFPCS